MSLKHFKARDFEEWEKGYRINFFNSLGGFKSLNLIGTKSKSGLSNLGTFFSVMHVGANPPLVGILFRPTTVPRHTLQNIHDTGYFTINSVPESILFEAHQASAKYDEGVSEFEQIGIAESWNAGFPAPYVQNSGIKMGLSYVEHHQINANATTFLVGKVEECLINETALSDDGFVDHTLLDNLAVNGLDTYYKAQTVRKLPRAKVETKKES